MNKTLYIYSMANPITDIHFRLNHVDVIKDAKEPSENIHSNNLAFFNNCVAYLFRNVVNNYKVEIDTLHNIINKTCSVGTGKVYPKTRIPILRHPLDKFVSLLPKRIKYAVQDSGLSPNKFKDVIYLVTPGSYIDAAKRSSDNQYLFYGFDHRITKSDFLHLGFQHIESFSTKLNEYNECTVKINYTFMEPLDIVFSEMMDPRDSSMIFFTGNINKNKWFNNVKEPINKRMYAFGCALILSKVLGDTLQAYYGKLFEQSLSDGGNRVCLFTCDTILTDRCRLMKLPVVSFNHEKYKNETYECVYYPTEGIIDTEMKTIFETYLISHNESVKHIINTVLTIGYCIVDKYIIHLTNEHKRIFEEIKSNIHALSVSCTILQIQTINMSPDDYRSVIMKYLAPHPFSIHGGYYYVCDVQLAKRLLPRVLHGGGLKQISNSIFNEEYASWGDDLMEELPLELQLKRRIILVLRDKVGTLPNHILVPRTKLIFDKLFRYFAITGETTLNFSSLKKLVNYTDQYQS